MLIRREPKQFYWVNRDHDIPVKFINKAGSFAGVEFALVEYEGNQSYVPYNELVLK
jgi:hypothetical protein